MKTGRWVAVALLLLAAPAAADDIDETVGADPKGNVWIENVAGSVTVTAWDRAEVQVKGSYERRVREVEIDADGEGDVSIEVVVPDHMRGGGYEADLEIRVPKGASVEVETVSASIDVEGVEGSLELESVSGAVDVRGPSAGVEAGTVSGSIEVRGDIAWVEAESVSGSVEITDTKDQVEASTTSGRIEIRGGDYDQVSCESVSGRILFEGGLRKDAQVDVESFSGTVVLRLPADLDADIEAETFSGSIDSDFGDPRRERFGPGEWLSTTVGKGSARIDVSSFSSSIRLEKR